MTSTGQKKTLETPPTTNLTVYEISTRGGLVDDGSYAWRPVAEQTGAGAHGAIRAWAEKQGDTFAGGMVRAIPKSRITEVDVKVETKRQLTLGAPGA